ncbi:MAG TPA: hypothetical protein VG937_39345 [Polyangiaceae bacterium]|jgi:hypothetical protein|nr:hypothetical protein [Polyangiaceae bacterium]
MRLFLSAALTVLLLASPAHAAESVPPPPTAVTPAPSTPPSSAQPAPSPVAPSRPFALALFTEAALGFSGDGFYNHLVGPRLDYHAGDHLTLGAALSYINLKGKNGRASNVLPAAMLEWRSPLGSDVALPVRFFSGYLPRNGPWLKAALGLSRRLGSRTTITFEAIAPALWVVRDSTVGSFDASLELAIDL